MSNLRHVGRAVALALLVATASLLAACNTVEGVGRDIRAAGNAIEGAAKDAKR